jgi:hypothetical protein
MPRNHRAVEGPAIRSRWTASLPHLLLILPLLGAIVFVRQFAIALPLTDEWFFLQGVMSLENVDLLSIHGLAEAHERFPTNVHGHYVGVPFLLYRAIAGWAHYDSRLFIYVTVAVFALEAWLFRRRLVTSSAWALPVVMLIFSPSHYMELMWGWQFTMAFSIGFALLGLSVLARMPATGGWRARAWRVTACLSCLVLATLSSAPGFFAFPCAVLIVALAPTAMREKSILAGVLVLATVVVYAWLWQDKAGSISPSADTVLRMLTALGGTIFGTPEAYFEFGVDLRSITGFIVLACIVAIVARAARIGALSRLSLALGITLFGLLCIASAALVRTFLGNWHLQLAVPALCGAYAAGWSLWRADRSLHSAVPFFALLALFVAGAWGWFAGFTQHGPAYHRYVRSVESFATSFLEHPELSRPYPSALVLTPEMVLFLSAKEHPLFADVPPPGALRPLPEGARVFVGLDEVGPSPMLTAAGRPRMLTVVVRSDAGARGAVAQFGSTTLVLRKLHARHNKLECCRGPRVSCFTGLVLDSELGEGVHAVRLSLFD